MAAPAYATQAVDEEPADETSTSKSTTDNNDQSVLPLKPAITTLPATDQSQLQGMELLQLSASETDPEVQGCSIRLLKTASDEVVIDSEGSPVEITQTAPNCQTLVMNWDTAKVPDDSYRIRFSAFYTPDAPTIIDIGVAVMNATTEPVYPPIDPELEPIPISETIETPLHRALPNHILQEPVREATPTDTSPVKQDVLAERVKDTAAATNATESTPLSSCARFFGVCWYVSVPITGLISSALYYAAYRIQKRFTRTTSTEAYADI